MNSAYDLRNLRQSYDEDVIALKLDKYSIQSGTVTALVGPNGSGKSTLLDLLAFVRLPVSGDISFFGAPVTSEQYPQLRQQTGYLQQKPYLFNITVAQNVELGLKLRNLPKPERLHKTMEIIESFGLLPLAGRRAHELSGGEIQRVALARAMVLQPRVLILDEPFSHLDRNFRSDLEQLLRDIRKPGRQTVIFSTHDQLQAQMLADNICMLIDGHVVPTLVINLFRGNIDGDQNIFDTGKVRIHIPSGYRQEKRLAIESTHLVISRQELDSSMRNSFLGRVTRLTEESGKIHVTVVAGETFHVMITPEAWCALQINIGDEIWISFKSTAVYLF